MCGNRRYLYANSGGLSTYIRHGVEITGPGSWGLVGKLVGKLVGIKKT